MDDVPDTVLLGKITDLGRRTWQVPKREGCKDSDGKRIDWTTRKLSVLGQKEKSLRGKKEQLDDSRGFGVKWRG